LQDHCENIIIQTLPPPEERPPLFVVGDVHGCAFELHSLLKHARQKSPQCLIVMVGDLFTKGPDPIGVLHLIEDYQAISIKGNHDWALAAALFHSKKHGFERLPYHTIQTLKLIKNYRRTILSLLLSLPHIIKKKIDKNNYQNKKSTQDLHIVHAGIHPFLKTFQTTERMLLTARWLKWDHSCENKRLVLIHSTSRSEFEQESSLRKSQSLPPLEGQRFRWHEFFDGPELIIFGHDAKQGLFRKTTPQGIPICIGIDTGCTYGRSLTGYFPDTDDIIQVPSEKTYFDLKNNCIHLNSYKEICYH